MASVSTVVVIPKNLAISAKSANCKSWETMLLHERKHNQKVQVTNLFKK